MVALSAKNAPNKILRVEITNSGVGNSVSKVSRVNMVKATISLYLIV